MGGVKYLSIDIILVFRCILFGINEEDIRALHRETKGEGGDAARAFLQTITIQFHSSVLFIAILKLDGEVEGYSNFIGWISGRR